MVHSGSQPRKEETQLTKPSTNMDTSPKSEPHLELHSRAAQSVEAHHRSDGPDTRINSGGRWIKKRLKISQNLYKYFEETHPINETLRWDLQRIRSVEQFKT